MPKYILVKLERGQTADNGRAFKNLTNITPPLGFTVQTEEETVYAYSLVGVLTHIGGSLTVVNGDLF